MPPATSPPPSSPACRRSGSSSTTRRPPSRRSSASLGLELWSGDAAQLAFVGAKAHTLILAPPGRGWLPTGRPAEPHAATVTVTGGAAGAVVLAGVAGAQRPAQRLTRRAARGSASPRFSKPIEPDGVMETRGSSSVTQVRPRSLAHRSSSPRCVAHRGHPRQPGLPHGVAQRVGSGSTIAPIGACTDHPARRQPLDEADERRRLGLRARRAPGRELHHLLRLAAPAAERRAALPVARREVAVEVHPRRVAARAQQRAVRIGRQHDRAPQVGERDHAERGRERDGGLVLVTVNRREDERRPRRERAEHLERPALARGPEALGAMPDEAALRERHLGHARIGSQARMPLMIARRGTRCRGCRTRRRPRRRRGSWRAWRSCGLFLHCEGGGGGAAPGRGELQLGRARLARAQEPLGEQDPGADGDGAGDERDLVAADQGARGRRGRRPAGPSCARRRWCSGRRARARR